MDPVLDAFLQYIEHQQKQLLWKLNNVPYPNLYYRGYDIGILQEYEQVKKELRNRNVDYFLNKIKE